MKALVYEHNLARVTSLNGSRAELSYDLERGRWPWLALPPQHPVVIEKFQYFSAVTVVLAQQLVDPNVFTALTDFSWDCPALQGTEEHATHGVCADRAAEGIKGYELTLRTPEGEVLASTRGIGVDFPDRDTVAWRSRARAKALAADVPSIDGFASSGEVGLAGDAASFLSPARVADGEAECRALVTTEQGFHPHHPFHTGSGDHVNAGHLYDCALQAAHLFTRPETPLVCVGGTAKFLRFTELDVPFEIKGRAQASDDQGRQQSSFVFTQLGRDTAHITLRWRGRE